ncbi:MAG TPA: NADH-quinone oxidoreductase subunit NuoK [Candidatus Kapabacteria bacterium]|nr:NADH-quinone oxidoreductase subunit NuoK [Candidatus Kapabacteria bacterium]
MSLTPVGLPHFLTVAAILFSLGIYAVIARRSGLMMLAGIQLLLASAGINFIAFSRYSTGDLARAMTGHVAVIIMAVLALGEAIVAMAIIRNLHGRFSTVNVDEADILRD